jgi:8-oxo-dGTP pyrophosphatase MutT (NUDIX family)
MITIADIEGALSRPAPAPSSDFDYVQGVRAKAGKLRPAAVLIALLQGRRGLEVILTRRAAHLRNHPGQVAFPGGKVEDSDAGLWAAAMRESREEIGLQSARKLGALQGHESVTGFEISPQVGLMEGAFTPRPDPSEVEEVFTVPLDFLMNPANMRLHKRGGRGYLAIPYGPHYIWGASARMIRNLAERI